MKKRGTYIIFTGCGSSNRMGGPSWLNGVGPSTKEFLSNELYFPIESLAFTFGDYAPIVNAGGGAYPGNNVFNCDFGDDSPEEIWGIDNFRVGIPVKDSKGLLMDALSRYDCEHPIDLPFEFDVWNGYKTLNFKKFLMSRGFDVEIYDTRDLVEYTGMTTDNDGNSNIKQFVDNYETYTGKSSLDVEYVLIANGPKNANSTSMRDHAEVYTDVSACSGHDGIKSFAKYNGNDPDDNAGGGGTKGDHGYGYFWPDSSGVDFGQELHNDIEDEFANLPQAAVGRWVARGTSWFGHDLGFKVLNTIEYHTNEAQKAMYYNPNYDTTGDNDNIDTSPKGLLVSWCSKLQYTRKTECEENNGKWNYAEPGYQYEKLMGCYNNEALQTSQEVTLAPSETDPFSINLMGEGGDKNGLDYEPPKSKNPEFYRRYTRLNSDEAYLDLMREAAEWNEANPSPREEDGFDCDDGYFWDVVEEECIPAPAQTRAFITPVNLINWLRRRWNDLRYSMYMLGDGGGSGASEQYRLRQEWPKGWSVFNYRGSGTTLGPTAPNLTYSVGALWWEGSLNRMSNPMVGLTFACDICDFENMNGYQSLSWGDMLMDPGMARTGGFANRIGSEFYPGFFAAMVGPSELHTESRHNNHMMSQIWRYMMGEVSDNFVSAKTEQRGWEMMNNQEIGYALEQAKFSMQYEPDLDRHEGSYTCPGTMESCYDNYRLSYNILGDPSLSFYVGKPKKIYIEQNNEPTNLALREGIDIPLSFTISLGSGHAGVRLDEAVGVVLYNRGDGFNDDWITLTKSYSDDNGFMEFNIPDDELPVGEVELFIQINRYQHWPVNFRVYYNS